LDSENYYLTDCTCGLRALAATCCYQFCDSVHSFSSVFSHYYYPVQVPLDLGKLNSSYCFFRTSTVMKFAPTLLSFIVFLLSRLSPSPDPVSIFPAAPSIHYPHSIRFAPPQLSLRAGDLLLSNFSNRSHLLLKFSRVSKSVLFLSCWPAILNSTLVPSGSSLVVPVLVLSDPIRKGSSVMSVACGSIPVALVCLMMSTPACKPPQTPGPVEDASLKHCPSTLHHAPHPHPLPTNQTRASLCKSLSLDISH